MSILGILLTAACAGAWGLSALYSRMAVAEVRQDKQEVFNGEAVKEIQNVNITLTQIKTILEESKK